MGKSNHHLMMARNALKESLKGIPKDSPIGVAVSGGADSLALMAGLSTLYRGDRAHLVHVITVDHQLQKAAKNASQMVVEKAGELGFSTHSILVEVGSSGSMEEAARTARYEAFEKVLSEFALEVILIGHTKNDQAEQVLLGLLRGSGTRSLSGIPEVRGIYRRPFLNALSRKDTEAVCEEIGWEYWVDPHNSSLEYQRVVARTLLREAEEAFGQTLVNPLVRSASISREDDEALEFYSRQAHSSLVKDGFTVEALTYYPKSVRKRAIKTHLLSLGVQSDAITSLILERIEELVSSWRGQGAVSLHGGWSVSRKNGEILFHKVDN